MNHWSGDPGGAFAAAMIVFIAWNEAEGKPGEFPRLCPGCHAEEVIGHGWRWRHADDGTHQSIHIRRGLCKQCGRTITMLPAWLVPGGHYSLLARQQAEHLAAGESRSLEECIPASADKNRCADPTTVSRWFRRRLESLSSLVRLWPQPPTLFAGDWKAAGRLLLPGINSA